MLFRTPNNMAPSGTQMGFHVVDEQLRQAEGMKPRTGDRVEARSPLPFMPEMLG
jgi:hypothetical protein